MKRLPAILLLAFSLCGGAQKQIYIPEDLQGMDLQSDTSRWSLRRSVQTDDIIVMWEHGFPTSTYNWPCPAGDSRRPSPLPSPIASR